MFEQSDSWAMFPEEGYLQRLCVFLSFVALSIEVAAEGSLWTLWQGGRRKRNYWLVAWWSVLKNQAERHSIIWPTWLPHWTTKQWSTGPNASLWWPESKQALRRGVYSPYLQRDLSDNHCRTLDWASLLPFLNRFLMLWICQNVLLMAWFWYLQPYTGTALRKRHQHPRCLPPLRWGKIRIYPGEPTSEADGYWKPRNI